MKTVLATLAAVLLAAVATAQPVPSHIVPLAPCRIFDSHSTPGSALAAGSTTYIAAREVCNVPADANGILVAMPAGVTVWGGDTARPTAASSDLARLCYPRLECGNPTYGSGTADLAVYVPTAQHVILDISGYTVPAE